MISRATFAARSNRRASVAARRASVAAKSRWGIAQASCQEEIVTYPTSPSSLPCPSCGAEIGLASVEWCQCISKGLSVVCPSCRNCFCNLRQFAKRAEWSCALLELWQEQTEEKFRRASNGVAPSSETTPMILVVDDDEEIRLIAEYTIQQMGYRTSTAAGAEEALAFVKRSRPDVVLTDALMPKTDGRELCRLIKTMDHTVKVVVMTALYTSSRYRVEAMSIFQADEYLAKPIDFARLQQVLGSLLAKKAA
jgi:CheY-like chemotaxis protein